MKPRSNATVELVVVSGKGGTGKTTVAASLASLASPAVMADLDVDAANWPLLLDPVVQERHAFTGGQKARIMPGHCVACGKCEELCRFDAISFTGPGNGVQPRTFRVDPLACEGCGVCVHFCNEKAIALEAEPCGQWYVSKTRLGTLVHARLDPAAGNSGKLVSQLRRKAAELAAREEGLVLCDGSPGIGCPVIASITGATLVLIVAEPSCSGIHDLERIAGLCRHFGLPAAVCVNRWDINEAMTTSIERWAAEAGLPLAGRVRYDPAISEAQMQRRAVVEFAPTAQVAHDLRRVWEHLSAQLLSLLPEIGERLGHPPRVRDPQPSLPATQQCPTEQ